MSDTSGTLFVVATPIGNLADLSPRACEILRSVDGILAEDTRTFGKLAAHFNITAPARSYFDGNEIARTDEALQKLASGANLALVSEAGTPAISDPGYRIISACREAGIKIIGIPGPCAAVLALSICGFEIERFYFEGFLPQKKGKREQRIKNLLEQEVASVIYESPYRIVKTLAAIAALAPERDVFVGRELTKMYEETLRGPATEISQQLAERKSIKGEFVLVVRGNR